VLTLAIYIGVVVFGLGAGYSSSVRGLVASLTEVQHHNLAFSTMGMLDVLGTCIGALLWAGLYDAGLNIGGWWMGLPFAVAAGMLLLVLGSVEFSKILLWTKDR
jgi:hypothetical protein